MPRVVRPAGGAVMDGPAAHRAFEALRAQFAVIAPEVRHARLKIVNRRCAHGDGCALRDLAWMQGGDVFLLRRALAHGRDVVRGLLAHELGHAADPDVWLPGSEQRADDIAERATGHRIRYTRRLRVQTFGPGIYPRPSDLHA